MKRFKPTTILEYILLTLFGRTLPFSYGLDGSFSYEARSGCL